jgi:hypothetical protein
VIVLDTNVLSELMRPTPEPNVVIWLDGLPVRDVATTAVTAAELLYGVARLPDGQRKTTLAVEVERLLREEFIERVVPFDVRAAGYYAGIVDARDRLGLPISISDAQIAAICASTGAALATRNAKDFTHTGVKVINPWDTALD